MDNIVLPSGQTLYRDEVILAIRHLGSAQYAERKKLIDADARQAVNNRQQWSDILYVAVRMGIINNAQANELRKKI